MTTLERNAQERNAQERIVFGCDWFSIDGVLSDIIECLQDKAIIIRNSVVYKKYSVSGVFKHDNADFNFEVFVHKGRFSYYVHASDQIQRDSCEQYVSLSTPAVDIASALVLAAEAIRQAYQEPEVDFFSQENIVSRLRHSARVPGATAARAMMGL